MNERSSARYLFPQLDDRDVEVGRPSARRQAEDYFAGSIHNLANGQRPYLCLLLRILQVDIDGRRHAVQSIPHRLEGAVRRAMEVVGLADWVTEWDPKWSTSDAAPK